MNQGEVVERIVLVKGACAGAEAFEQATPFTAEAFGYPLNLHRLEPLAGQERGSLEVHKARSIHLGFRDVLPNRNSDLFEQIKPRGVSVLLAIDNL